MGGAALAWVAAAAYSSFLLAGWAHSPLPTTTSLVSELEAARQSHHALFRLTDVLSGISILASRRTSCAVPAADQARSAVAACFSLCSVSPRSPTGATYMACAPSADAMCRAQDYSVHGLLAQLIQLHTISGLIGVVAATGAMYLIGTAAEPTSRVFGLISIGCGLGVAVIGLLDIPLLLTNSVIGLGERGRILLISIWLAALGMQQLVHNILPLRLRRHRWWRRAGATSLVSSGWRLGNE